MNVEEQQHEDVEFVDSSTPSRFPVGTVWSNGEYGIAPEHLGLFPMGDTVELRLRQDKATRNLRRSARAKHIRDTLKLSGVNDGEDVEEGNGVLEEEDQRLPDNHPAILAGKRPRTLSSRVIRPPAH